MKLVSTLLTEKLCQGWAKVDKRLKAYGKLEPSFRKVSCYQGSDENLVHASNTL